MEFWDLSLLGLGSCCNLGQDVFFKAGGGLVTGDTSHEKPEGYDVADGWVRVLAPGGGLLGVGELRSGRLLPRVVPRAASE